MKILVYTSHSPEFSPLAVVTEPPKRLYAYRHGYDFRSEMTVKELSPQGHFGYGKIVDIIRMMDLRRQFLDCHFAAEIYDWVWWSGCDVLVTNPAITLESIIDNAPQDTELIIANDAVMWSGDSFLIRVNHRSIDFLKAVLEAQGLPQIFQLAEQEEMWNRRNMLHVHEVPQKVLTPYLYEFRSGLGYNDAQRTLNRQGKDLLGNDGRWSPGDFVLHLSGLEDFSLRCWLASHIAAGRVPKFSTVQQQQITWEQT